jgi:hypothetical protein
MAMHGDFSPEARDRAMRTVVAAVVFADNAEVIVAELPGLADEHVLVAVVDGAFELAGLHPVPQGELMMRVPELETSGGWAMVFSPTSTVEDVRRRANDMADIAEKRASAIDRITARRAAE